MPRNYNPAEVEQFATEFLGRARAHREERKLWERALDHRRLASTVRNRSEITQAYAADPTKSPDRAIADAAISAFGSLIPGIDLDEEKIGQVAERVITRRRSDFTQALEGAWQEHSEDIPMSWFMQWSPADLRYFAASPDIADHIEEVQHQMVIEQQFQDAVEAETNRIAQARMNNRGLVGSLVAGGAAAVSSGLRFFGADPGQDITAEDLLDASRKDISAAERAEIRRQVELQFLGRGDEVHEEKIGEYLADAAAEFDKLKGNPSHPLHRIVADVTKEEWLSSKEAEIRGTLVAGGSWADATGNKPWIQRGVENTVGAIGWTIDKAGRGLDGVLWTLDAVSPVPTFYDAMKAEHEAEQEQILADMKSQLGAPDEDMLRRAFHGDLRTVFEQMQTENPAQFDEYMLMAGYDFSLAFSFFSADVFEAPEAEEQMAQVAEQLMAEERQMIEDFEAQDFRVSGKLLDLMASYGRNIPGRLSTYATLLLTDGDFFDQALSGEWGTLFTELEKQSEQFGHTPSAALGIEGSLSGLMLDLGAGIAFDPLTWIFGPRASVRTVKAGSAAQARAVAQSATTRQLVKDTVRMIRSPSHGVADILHSMSWGDTQLINEVMDVAGYQVRQLPHRRWKAFKGAENAMEVQTSFLRGLIDDIPDFDSAALSDDILANGFREFTQVTISRGDGMVYLDDGAKRVIAAERAGITHVPVRLRILDDFSATPANLTDEVVDTVTRDRIVSFGQRVRGKGDTLFETTLDDGRTLTVTSAGSPKKPAVFAYVDGDAVGGFERSNIGLLDEFTGAVKPLTEDGRSVAQAVVDGAEQIGASPLQAMAGSQALTKSAYSFLKKEAERLGQTLPFDSPVGRSLDDVLDGRSSRKALKGSGSGDVWVRPDQFFPHELLVGEVNEAALREATERAIMRGLVPDGAHRSAIAVAWNGAIRKAAQTSKGTRWVERYLTQQNTVRRLELAGAGALDRLFDMNFRIWGDDVIKADQWATRFMEWQRQAHRVTREASERMQALVPMRHELDELLDHLGGSPYSELKGVDEATQAARKMVQADYDDLLRKFEAEFAQIDAQLARHSDTTSLARLVEEMYADYNRTYIATNKGWAGRVGEDGLVPWDDLNKGWENKLRRHRGIADDVEGRRQFLTEEMQLVAKDLGVNGEDLVKRLSSTLQQAVAVQLPASPLELTIARELGAAAYTRITQRAAASAARDTLWTMQRAWIIDKVLRPATAITVSFDEWQRIMHIGGTEAFLRWNRDRALFLRARAQQVLHGRSPFKADAVRQGSTHLSPRSQARIQALSEYPTYLKQAERQLYDGNGLGWVDIQAGDAQFVEAAQRWTGGLLQDSGFRAFLRGPDDFREWFFSPDGETVRRANVLRSTDEGVETTLLTSPDDVYQGFETLMSVIFKKAQKNGEFDNVMQAFRDTAAKIDSAGGVPHELPGFVFDNLDSVRGVQKTVGARVGIDRLTESFFDRMFMDPVNTRRGFLAEQVRQAERVRLERLFASQNKRIISDLEIERALGLKGLGGGTRSGLKDMLYEQALNKGFVPQGYIDDLIERTVQKEIDNVLFTWDRGTRLGAQSTAVFPFGRPWADMAGFWGREIMRKPVLRGWINESNFLGMRSAYNKIPMPFNPKPAAMMSRLAHTDFTIDQGLHPSLPGGFGEGGILPGSDETDFSPMFFLPTGGDNPFGALLPGFGYVPIAFIDKLISDQHDPIEEPEQYQRLLDQIGDFIPSVHYNRGGAISRILGGGTAGTLANTAINAAGYFTGEPFYNLSSTMGDITREIDRTREISALLADPEEFQELLNAGDEETVEMLLLGLSHEADRRVSSSHFMETVARFVVPASQQFDTGLHEIHDVWVEAATTFPALQVRPDLQNADLDDPDVRRRYANDVRSAFFDLPTWQRDLYVAMQPSLAVNLVGSWEWTTKAVNRNLPGTDQVYRTSAKPEDLALHQQYVNEGLIRPVQPVERAKRIVGLMQASKERAAKQIYEVQAKAVNNLIWEQAVDEDTRQMLSAIVNSDFADRWAIVDERDLWDNWSSMEERVELALAEQMGIDPDSEDFDRIKDRVKIPSKQKPWGKSWPGLDDEELSQRFQGVTFNSYEPETVAIAQGLGIELAPGMTGLALFREVQDVITQVDSPLFSTVRPAYDRYISEKGIGARAAEAELAKAKHNPDLDQDWRNNLANWMVRADRLTEQYRNEAGGVPLSVARELTQEYGNMVASSDLDIAWQGIWEDKYQRTLGPLEWEAPVPQAPLDENGVPTAATMVPYVRYIPDGDTIVFKERRNAEQLRTVRLLGVNARDYGIDPEGAAEDKTRLQDALRRAVDEGATIYLVRDPLFGDTDHYGRALAWLWIGDEPFYFEDELRSTVTPSEASR